MKNIGILIAVFGLVSSAIYAMGGFSGITSRMRKVKVKSRRSENRHPKNKIRRSYTYGAKEREY
jgi:hypothetical protein